MKIKLLFVVCLALHLFTYGQQRQLSSEAEISVLTIGPGTLLNDSFGHNAFRIKDKIFQIDIVFNYGVYDFSAPNFYLKFARGKLNYLMDADAYQDFYSVYARQDRTIQEQTLNLSQPEKQQLYEYLLNNYKPENRFYLYDFFYDNCATRIRDVVADALQEKIEFNIPKNFEEKTFRALIHDHVDRNTWGSFGIDVALGAVIDKKASPNEHMYLPKYIYEFFESATYNNEPLVKESKVIYQKAKSTKSKNFWVSPLFIFGILGILIIIITYKDHKKQRRSKCLDLFLFGITGSIGLLVLLLWFATDHTATAQNYNLLWAFPLNLFVIHQLYRKQIKGWFLRYLKFLVIMLSLLTMHWLIGVQIYALGLIPLLIALFIRYIYLVIYYNTALKAD
jgi:hypothetical protein